jgi:hypothetical protein
MESIPEAHAQALLVNVSADGGEPWDWHRISSTPPPLEPARTSEYETAARAVLRKFRPGLVARITGAAKRRRAELERAVLQAANADVLRYSAAVAAHRAAHHEWSIAMSLAPGVLRLDETACRAALRFAMAYRDLSEMNVDVFLDSVSDGVATLTCAIDDPDHFPLAARTRASSSRIPIDLGPTPLADDHICSLAIRIARETFSILPIAVAVVSVTTQRRDPVTGQFVIDTLLGTRFSLQTMSKLHGHGLAPSQPMPNLAGQRLGKGSTPPYAELSAEEEWEEDSPIDWDADTVRLLVR